MKSVARITAATVAVLLFLPIFSIFVNGDIGDSWTSKANMQTPRAYFGAAVVSSKIYAIGGTGDRWAVSNVNEEYDPATDTWIVKKPMPTARREFGIAAFENKIYCIGGWSESALGLNEMYDPSTDTWESREALPTNRRRVTTNVVNGKLYVIGGLTQDGYYSNRNEVYDPATDTWQMKAPVPESFVGASAVVNNKIFFIGSKLLIYDPERDSWNYGAAPLYQGHSMVAAATTGIYAPKRIYCLVSRDISANDPRVDNINQVYDPEDDSWTVAAAMQRTRFFFAIAVVKDRLYAIGGMPFLFFPFDPHPILSSENEEYMPIGYIQDKEDQMPQPFPAASVVAAVLVVGLVVSAGFIVYFRKRKYLRSSD